MRAFALVAGCLLAASACIGPAPTLRGQSQTTALWGRWEQAFEADRPPAQFAFTARFTAPSGSTREVEGFWDGGSVWRVRFMPDEEGLWTYETETRPYVAGLAGRRGSFICYSHRETDNPLLRHGPVSVATGGTYFVHRDGTPFFWMGDTAWNGPLRARQEDWRTYLDTRRAQSFSVVQFVATQWRAAVSNRMGLRAYEGFEQIQINPEFFRRLDDRIDEINQAGLLAAPVLLWALGDERMVPGRLPESEAIKLAHYLTARYGAHHVAWMLGGDADYRGENAERWKRIGNAVFGDGEEAPVLLHPQGMQWPWEEFADEAWLTAFGYQSGHGDDDTALEWIHSGPPAVRWRDHPGTPVLNLEPPYEDILAYQSGERHTAYSVRRAVYWSLLSTPVAGVSYGAHGVWSWESERSVPLNHERSGAARPWQEALHLPGGDDMRHVASLFTRLAWWRLTPDPALVAHQFSDPSSHIASARTPDGRTAIIYLPQGGEVSVDRTRLASGTELHWFNPRDGRRSTASPVGPSRYVAPDDLDWVLVATPRPSADETR